MKKSFTDLGEIVATCGVNNLANEKPEFRNFVQICFSRYCACDWGDLCEVDKALNDWSINPENKEPDQILARYNHPEGNNIYIITKWDRRVTTVLFPDEY